MEICGYTANDTWLMALEHLYYSGMRRESRNGPCNELINFHTVMPMIQPIVTVAARNLGYRFMFAEAFWILTGDYRVDTITPFSKQIAQFSDDGVIFFGAYGPKIMDQIDGVVNLLGKSPDTRQAVITIWRENPPISKDIPCTISAQFIIREDTLHCIDNMRSSDVWLGWPYDTFNFTMLSSAIMLLLNDRFGMELKLGNLHMNLGSFHLYESNKQQAKECLKHGLVQKFNYPLLDPIREWTSLNGLLHHLYCVSRNDYERLISRWCHCIARGDHNK